jgi:hypothetical protein
MIPILLQWVKEPAGFRRVEEDDGAFAGGAPVPWRRRAPEARAGRGIV